MIQKKLILILAIILVCLLAIIAILRFSSPEDTWICQDGQWVKHGNPSAAMPTTACGQKISEAPLQEGNIVVDSPRSGDSISSPVKIEGKARVFENMFNYRLKDSDGTVLDYGSITAIEPDPSNYGKFSINIDFNPKGDNGTLEVFDYSAKDGSEIDMVSIPLKFLPAEKMSVKAYFGNNRRDPKSLECDSVFPIERIVQKTEAVGRAALEELLKGPTQKEQNEGYFTSINDNVKIQKLTIEDGIAKVDFDKQLEYQLGGSCRVTAIRAQIEQTLKQFSTVKEVIISIDGRAEDILQP